MSTLRSLPLLLVALFGVFSLTVAVHIVEDTADFDSQVNGAGNRLVVVMFEAIWCRPCKMITPLYEELAASMVDKVTFLKVDAEENEVSYIFIYDFLLWFDMPHFLFLPHFASPIAGNRIALRYNINANLCFH